MRLWENAVMLREADVMEFHIVNILHQEPVGGRVLRKFRMLEARAGIDNASLDAEIPAVLQPEGDVAEGDVFHIFAFAHNTYRVFAGTGDIVKMNVADVVADVSVGNAVSVIFAVMIGAENSDRFAVAPSVAAADLCVEDHVGDPDVLNDTRYRAGHNAERAVALLYNAVGDGDISHYAVHIAADDRL